MIPFLIKRKNRKAAKRFREKLLECLKPKFPELHENHKHWDTHYLNVTPFATAFFYLGAKGHGDHIQRNWTRNDTHFILKGLKIKRTDGLEVVPFEVHVDGNLISSIKIAGDRLYKAYDLETIDVSEMVQENIVFKNDEKKKLLAIIGHVPAEQLALLEVEDTLKIDLNGQKFFTILNMEDGNYIAVDKKARVFRLHHDSYEEVKSIAPSITDFLASYNGDKETLAYLFD